MTEPNQEKEPAGWVLPAGAALCALLWGSAFPTIKYAYGMMDADLLSTRLAFAGLRFTLAGLILLVLVPNRRQKFMAASPLALIAIALIQTTFQYAFFYSGLAMVSGVLAAILVATGSFWWVFLAPLFEPDTRLTRGQLGVLMLGFAGVCICVWQPGQGLAGHPLGILMVMGTAFCGALSSLLVRRLKGRIAIPFLTGFALFVGGLVLLAVGAPALPALIASATPLLWGMILYLALISAAAFSLWYWLVGRFDVARLGGYRFLIPVCGATESALFIPGESITVRILIGGVLVLICVRLLERLRVIETRGAQVRP